MASASGSSRSFGGPGSVPSSQQSGKETQPTPLANTDFHRSQELGRFLTRAGCYESLEETMERQSVISDLQNLLNTWIRELTNGIRKPRVPVERIEGRLITYGSYKLGGYVRGPRRADRADIDGCCVVPRNIRREDFFASFVKLLKEQEDVTDVRGIEHARVPVIRMNYRGIDVDLIVARVPVPCVTDDLTSAADAADVMPIITPAYPECNSAGTVTPVTFKIIKAALERGRDRWKDVLAGRCRMHKMFDSYPFFSTYKIYMVIIAKCESKDNRSNWYGYVESRLITLQKDLEKDGQIILPHLWPINYDSVDATGNAQRLWLIGLKCRAAFELDLTNQITFFLNSVPQGARFYKVEEMGLDADLVYRTRLSKYLPSDVINADTEFFEL